MSETLPPPRMSDTTKVVSEGTNTMVMPLTMPATLWGMSTWRSVGQKPAPRSCEASMMSSSILARAL